MYKNKSNKCVSKTHTHPMGASPCVRVGLIDN